MSHQYRGPNASARDTVALILDKAHQLPTRGVHVGGGAHITMPETWDGNGPVPPGWTSFLSHRNGEDVVFLPEPETQTKLARLTPAERAQLAAARAAAHQHPEPEQAPAEGRAR